MNERPSGLHARSAVDRFTRKFERIAGGIVAKAAERRSRDGRVMSEADKLAALIHDREVQTTILLACASAGTVMLTYFGVSGPMTEAGDGVVHKGQALAFAFTIGIFSFLGWEYTFKIVHRLRGRRLAAALMACTIYIGGIAAIDAPFNMLALGGDQAVQYSLVDTLQSYERMRASIVLRSTLAERLLPILKSEAERFTTLAERELKTGSGSGKPGPGRVRDGYLQIGTLLSSLHAGLSEGLTTMRAVDAQAAAALRTMKTTAYAPGDIRQRVAAFSSQADQLDALLGEIAQRDAMASIRATTASLRGIIPSTGDARSDFEAVQNTELRRIAEMARSVASALDAAVDTVQLPDTVSLEPVRPQNAMTAIKTYWRPLLPQWVAALFVDFAPAILVVILLAARREVDRHALSTKPSKKER